MSPATEMSAINFYAIKCALLAWELNSKTTMFPILCNLRKLMYTDASIQFQQLSSIFHTKNDESNNLKL